MKTFVLGERKMSSFVGHWQENTNKRKEPFTRENPVSFSVLPLENFSHTALGSNEDSILINQRIVLNNEKN